MVEKYKITKKGEVYEMLKDKRNFQYMSETLLRRLINEMKIVRFTQKTLLLKQDTENHFIYIIIRGKVTVYLDKKPLYTLRRTGDVFGELSFATKSPSTASIVAEEGLGVMAISFNYLKKLNDVEFGLWLCHVLGEKLVRTSKLKTIRSIENIDELEGATPAKTKSKKAPAAAATADAASEKVEADIVIDDVLGSEESDDVEIEDVTEGDESGDVEIEDVTEGDESGDVEIEDVTEGDEAGDVEIEEVTESDEAGEADEETEAVAQTESAADDDDDDGEYIDMNFEP